MEKDQLLINKFLELLPDNFMEWIFNQLEQNMISVDRSVPIEIYTGCIEKYDFPFQNKNLKLAHSKFYKSFKYLQHFIGVNFFISHQATEFLVLHPDVKETNPEKYRELSNQLNELLDNTKNNYYPFRKKIEKFSLGGEEDLGNEAEIQPVIPIVKKIEEEEYLDTSQIVKNKYPDIKLRSKDKRGSLQLKKGSKWIDLGGYTTRTYKLTKYILEPTSKSKKVCDVFQQIRKEKDRENVDLKRETTRTYPEQKRIIKSTIRELRKKKFLKGLLNEPIFDDGKKEVVITFK